MSFNMLFIILLLLWITIMHQRRFRKTRPCHLIVFVSRFDITIISLFNMLYVIWLIITCHIFIYESTGKDYGNCLIKQNKTAFITEGSKDHITISFNMLIVMLFVILSKECSLVSVIILRELWCHDCLKVSIHNICYIIENSCVPAIINSLRR